MKPTDNNQLHATFNGYTVHRHYDCGCIDNEYNMRLRYCKTHNTKHGTHGNHRLSYGE